MVLKRSYTHILIALVLAVFFNCKDNTSPKTESQVVVDFTKEGVLNIKKADSDAIIRTLDIEIADDEYSIQTGLMYRTELETHQGMLFIFPDEDFRSFYMKNTKIPLDIIYIDANKSIVSVQKNTKPFDETSLPSEAPAKYVLEIGGGLFDEWGLEAGNTVDFEIIN
jgi:uncharacterized membrane protein (UPF0127 family)